MSSSCSALAADLSVQNTAALYPFPKHSMVFMSTLEAQELAVVQTEQTGKEHLLEEQHTQLREFLRTMREALGDFGNAS